MIPLSEPELRGNEWKYVKECLDSGWVSSAGPFVNRFEQEFAAYAGAPHALAVANGTAGLHVALLLAGVEPDDEVLVSTLTFVAPANAITYCRAHPVFVDADLRNWQMDVEKVRQFLENQCEIRDGACRNRATGRRVRAVLPVHILGLAAEVDRIVELAAAHHLKVIEDAAEAMGVRYKGRQIGTFGDLGVFSFNGNKIMTAGGGGMVAFSDGALAERARYLTTQARDDETEYVHNTVGWNYRLSNVQAAIGVAQLERMREFVERKRQIAARYAKGLSAAKGLTLMPRPSDVEPTYWLNTVLLPEGTTLDKRKQTILKLRDAGIGARPLWHPVNGLPPYRSAQSLDIQHAWDLYNRAISLPSSVGLSDQDLDRCIEVFYNLLGE